MNSAALSLIPPYHDVSRFHPGYILQIFQNLAFSAIPLHLFTFAQSFRFLDVFQIFHGWLPYLELPKRQIPFHARAGWTALVLAVFLVLEKTPMYALRTLEEDKLFWLRDLVISSQGSLMELGLAPIAVFAVIFYFIDIFDLLEPTRRSDLELLRTAKTALTMLVILSISLLYVQSGRLNIQMGHYNGLLVVIQLFGGGVLSYFLDEILDHYGICCAFTLLMAKNVCKMIFWQAFSPVTIDTGRGPEFEGSVICLVHLLFSWTNKARAVHESFFRQNQPNLISLGSTILVFLGVIYLQGVRIEMPVKSRETLGLHGTFQIKLLYSSNRLILYQYQAVGQMLSFSQFFHLLSPDFSAKWFWLVGIWQEHPYKQQLKSQSGLCYWLTPPTLNTLFSDPQRTLMYVIYMLSYCMISSRMSIGKEESKENPDQLILDLLGPTHLTMAGVREGDSDEALKREVMRLVPMASIIGGFATGLICIVSDVLGVVGGGHGVLIATSIMYSTYESWLKDRIRRERV